MAYVYRHIRLDKNEPFYIGIGSDRNYKRASSIKDRNKYWGNIVNKYGYEIEILINDLTWEEACNKEIEFIHLYGRKDLNKGSLVNLTNGGDGAKGVFFSNKRKKEISNRIKGKGNPFYGKKHSIETIQKFKYIAQNRLPEIYNKIALANSNKIIPKEVRIKISNSTKGQKNHFYGKNHTKQSKKKISIKAVGRILSDELKNKISLNTPKSQKLYKLIDNKIIEYNSIRDASKKTGISRSRLNNNNYAKYGFYDNIAEIK